MKKHNFNAGPSILADEVIQNAAKAIVDFNGSGLSLLSISHRTKDFENVMAEADALFRELLGIPDNYAVACMLPLGKPVKQVTKLTRRPVSEFATRERFDGPPL